MPPPQREAHAFRCSSGTADAAQPFAAPPHTSDPELGSSTTPAALVNTGERHPGNAPPQRNAHELPRRWSGDQPDKVLETYSDYLEWLEQLEQTPVSKALGVLAENEEDGYTNPHAAPESVSLHFGREMQETPDEAALYLDGFDLKRF